MNICSKTQLEGTSPTLAVKDFSWLHLISTADLPTGH